VRLAPPLALLCAACTTEVQVGGQCLTLSEVMADPGDGYWVGDFADVPPAAQRIEDGGLLDDEEPPDWVELCNQTQVPLRPEWYTLIDHDAADEIEVWPDPWRLPRGPRIAPGECVIVVLEPRCGDAGCAPFDLQSQNAYVRLASVDPADDTCVDWVWFQPRESRAYALGADQHWHTVDFASPGEPNP
jgi:hypothetical protein